MTIAAGTRMGSYEVLSLLGAGGMGEIYRARDLKLGREVALKVLPAAVAGNPDRRGRLEQEAYTVSRLNHPNVVTLHELGSADGVLFVVMELVEGRTLRAVLESGPVSRRKVMDIAVQVADGLAKAHAAGIVHRDLKPENLIVSDDGFVKILDFGLAKLTSAPPDLAEFPTLAQHQTDPGAVVGTVSYMSPEQARGASVDYRSDQFSLGTILYEMSVGRRPFERKTAAETMAAIINEDPEPLPRHDLASAASLEGIVDRCLAKAPKARYASTLTLAQDLRAARDGLSDASAPGTAAATASRRTSRALLVAGTVLVLAALGTAGWLLDQRRRARWAREEALPQIARLAEQGNFVEAVGLARKANASIPSDPALAKAWLDITAPATIETTPSGAEVYLKAYRLPESDWEYLGRTPLHEVDIPQGLLRLEIRKEGYRTVDGAIGRYEGSYRDRALRTRTVTLDEDGRIPRGMVRVSGGRSGIRMTGMEAVAEATLDDYLIDEKEVTNREFKTFVDAGGYRDQRYWRHPFVKGGRTLSWEEAIGEFKDRVGRPGPATWELGAYPAGQEDFPVAGVSWFEAAAYAEFAGKSLPTIYDWSRAAAPRFGSAALIPLSNVGGTGLSPVGSHPGWSVNGLYDVAGNVKEWCWNEAGRGRRYLLGGAWNEPPYMFADPDAQEPFARAETYGFRCARRLTDPLTDPSIFRAIDWHVRDASLEKPIPEAIFGAYKALYSYDKTDLQGRVESTDDSAEQWKKETVSFNAAYGGERVSAQLFVPRGFPPPHKVVVLFPGAGALYLRSLDEAGDLVYLDFVIRSGRAVLYPVYQSTFGRRDAITTDRPAPTSLYRDHVLQWSKDLGRSIDYLETRSDLDANGVAYYGFSWGACLGAILPAVEDRIRASILVGGGLEGAATLPEVSAVNFAPRVKAPTLMINGRYDFLYGVETSQIPLFRLLGTKDSDKRHVIRDSGHIVPREQMMKDVLDWLDRYLGPVEARRQP